MQKLPQGKASGFNFFPSVTGVVVAVGLQCLGGCYSWKTHDGERRTVVLGFGIIKETAEAGVEVHERKLLGLMAGPQGVAAGYVSQHSTGIDPRLAGPVVVSTCTASNRITVLPVAEESSPQPTSLSAPTSASTSTTP